MDQSPYLNFDFGSAFGPQATTDPTPPNGFGYAYAAKFCPPVPMDEPEPTDDEINEAVRQYLLEHPDPNGPGFASAEAGSWKQRQGKDGQRTLDRPNEFQHTTSPAGSCALILLPREPRDDQSGSTPELALINTTISSTEVSNTSCLDQVNPPCSEKGMSTSSDSTTGSNNDAFPSFIFESRAIVLQDRSRKPRRTQTSDGLGKIKCEYPGCKYRGNFNRIYELNRHMKKHDKESELRCPVVECDRCFNRTDKLRNHLRSKAHSNHELARCVYPGCHAKPMPIDLLKYHSGRHKYLFTSKVVLILADLSYHRHCPLTSCPETVKSSSMIEHFRSHSLADRLEERVAVETAGYSIAGDYLCPLCSEMCPTKTRFEDHLDAKHLVRDFADLLAFRADLKSRLPPWEVHLWQNLTSLWSVWYGCCACGVSQSEAVYNLYIKSRHLALLNDDEAIRTKRRAILNLVPEFDGHPIFDDLNPAEGL